MSAASHRILEDVSYSRHRQQPGRTVDAARPCKNKTGTTGERLARIFEAIFAYMPSPPGATTFQINQICSGASEAGQLELAWAAGDAQEGVETLVEALAPNCLHTPYIRSWKRDNVARN